MSNPPHRPPHMPTKEGRTLVQVMSATGFPQPQIAEQLGIDAKTLRKHYREELSNGKVSANAMIARSLFRKATGDGPQSVAAAIFWLKTQAGWRETPIEISGKVDHTHTSVDVLEAARARVIEQTQRGRTEH